MNKIFSIAKRDFLEIVKSKIFFVSLFLTPVIVVMFSALPVLLQSKAESKTSIVALLNIDDSLFNYFKHDIEKEELKKNVPAFFVIKIESRLPQSSFALADSLLRNGSIDAFIVRSKGNNQFLLYTSINEKYFIKTINNSLNTALINQSLYRNKINLNLNQYNIVIKEMNDNNSARVFLLILSLTAILIIVLIYNGGMFVRSFLEEKNNNIIEIILSSASPMQFLTGKLLSAFFIGLIQIIFWTAAAFLFINFSTVVTIQKILLISIYFLLSYIIFVEFFVGLGSVVKTEQQAQQLSVYLSILLFSPVIMFVSYPSILFSGAMNIAFYFPFTTITAASLKILLGQISNKEIIVSLLEMISFILMFFVLLKKIFVRSLNKKS